MKKKFTKIITVILSLVLLTCSFSVNVCAEEGFSYEFEKNCEALYMFNMDDGRAVYSLNADKALPMASLTKIMTYIIAAENIPDIENTVITVSDRIDTDLEGTDTSLEGIYAGEELTVLQLLNMLMIPSGSDAALALHVYYDENVAGVAYDKDAKSSPFIDLMNAKAEELGCTDTHFVNAHGLHDRDHYSTARDQAKIVQYAMTLPYFNEIVSTTVYKLPATNVYTEEREVTTINKMLLKDEEDDEYYYEYAKGIKTGANSEAGYCMAASATYEDETYIVIALGSPMTAEDGSTIDTHGEMLDAAELFKWAFSQLSRQDICIKSDVLNEAPLKYAWGKDTLQLVPAEDVSAMLPNDISGEDIETVLETPDMVETPVTQGTVLGKATFLYNGEVLDEVNLVAAESVDKSVVVQVFSIIGAIFTSIWFWLFVFILLAVGYIHLKKEQARRRRMRQMRRRREAARRRAANEEMRRHASSTGRQQRYSGYTSRNYPETRVSNYRSTTPRYSSYTRTPNYGSTESRYTSSTRGQDYRSTVPRYYLPTRGQSYGTVEQRYDQTARGQNYSGTTSKQSVDTRRTSYTGDKRRRR